MKELTPAERRALRARAHHLHPVIMIGEAGLTPEKIETHADVTLEKLGAAFEITASHLTVSARIPGADNAKFQEIANKAKTGCPVSKLLKAQITMDAKLEA